MDCDYKLISTLPNGMFHLKCQRKGCGYETDSMYGPALTHTRCEKDSPRGLGDTVAKLAKILGIKQCGGCKKRQKLLNRLVSYEKVAKMLPVFIRRYFHN